MRSSVGYSDHGGRFLYATPALAAYVGMTPDELIGRTWYEIGVPPEAVNVLEATRRQVLETGEPASQRVGFEIAGTHRESEFLIKPVLGPAGSIVGTVVTAWDVTDSRQTSRARARLDRAYSILDAISQVIVRTRNRNVILNEACRIAAAVGGFELTWVGLLDPDSGDVPVVFQAGRDEGLLPRLSISARDEPSGHGVVGTAIRENRSVIIQDVRHDHRMDAWRPFFDQLRYRTAAGFPIRVSGRPIGALALYSSKASHFDASEALLFEQFAGDISRALTSIEVERDKAEAETALAASEKRYRELFDINPHPMGVYDVETLRFLAVNDAALRSYGYSQSEFLAMTVKDIVPAADIPKLLTEIGAVVPGGGYRPSGPWRLLRKDGSLFDAEVSTHDLDFDGRPARLVMAVDISERRHTEARLGRLNRVLRTFAWANQALVRPTEEAELLQEFCSVAVEHGAFLGAWVGYREDDQATTIRPTAWAGPLEGYLNAISLSWQDPDRGSLGPAGTSIRDGRVVVVRDVATDPTIAWGSEMLTRGLRSVVALPLKTGDIAFGTLVIYASDPGSFGTVEIDLLEELASDLAYGVEALRARAAAAHGEAERRRLAVAVAQAADFIVVTDRDGVVEAVNPAFERLTGHTTAAVVGRTVASVLRSGVDPPETYAAIDDALRRGEIWTGRLAERRADGSLFDADLSISPIRDAEGALTGSVEIGRDVTREREMEAEQLREAQIRGVLAESLGRVRAEDTLELAAQTICDQLVTLPFIDVAAVWVFLGAEDVQVVAESGPPGYPVLAGDHLPPSIASLVQGRVARGPWAGYAAQELADDGWVARRTEAGLQALAYGPIVRGDDTVGALLIGTFDERFAPTFVEQMPAVVSFSATSSALLAERLQALRRDAERRGTLRAVLAARSFHPVFQPIVALETRETMGYEALTRFDSGQRPDHCFADAWSVGLGREMELSTLEAAVAEGGRLPSGRWLSLNVSPRLLADPAPLGELLRAAGRPLVLEITEHEVIDDYPALREAVRALGHDVRLAVDDAGAGVANFGHIIELSPELVKLDISLVRRVNANMGRQAMVVGMRHFSRTAGCRLIAEGIETEEEAATLFGLGVEFGQGYWLGRPEPVEHWTAVRAAARKPSQLAVPRLPHKPPTERPS